jgi:hypothetical protein
MNGSGNFTLNMEYKYFPNVSFGIWGTRECEAYDSFATKPEGKLYHLTDIVVGGSTVLKSKVIPGLN